MDFFLHLLVNGISLGFLYALSALGFVMIFKSSSVLNFAHGELLAMGAFLFLVLSTWAKLPIALAFALTLIGSFSLGFVVERFFLRPLIGEALIQVIMLTVGLAAMFKGLMLFIFGGDIHQYVD
ncbi:MAG TPA: branched-chain amino acid ABC transporter permease, partial [Acidobacteriota bacterium]|nr:branched-chain amino acid ABC transporter permease [Acidobacteriota bacterium]